MVAAAAATAGSAVLSAAKGMASCLGTSNSATSHGNTITNNVDVAVKTAGNTGSIIGAGAQVVTAASAAFGLALLAYKEYAAMDDHRLLIKMAMDDCGGLSIMLPKIEGCFCE